MKTPAMIKENGGAVYILDVRDWPTDGGVVGQFAIAPVGRYADQGLATAWVDADSVMVLGD